MSLDQNFDLHDAALDPADEAEDDDVSAPQPLVIIEYRNRGIPPYLIPPALVLLAAVVILSYQRQTPLRPLSPTQAVAPVPASSSAASPTPETQPMPAPPLAVTPKEIVSVPAQEPIVPAPVSEPAVATGESPPAPAPKPDATVALKATERPAPDLADPTVANEKLEPLEPEPTPRKAAVPAAPPPAAVPEPPKPPPAPESLFDLDPVEGLRKVKPGRAGAASEDVPEPANPEEALAVARAAPARRIAIGFNLPDETESPAPDLMPQPNPEVSKDEVEQAIQREAEEKEAERQELEAIKSRAKLLEIRGAIERAATRRVPFRNELRRVLKSAPPDEAGMLIDDLCDEYGRETLPEILDTVRLMIKRMSGRASRGDAVALMRRLGLPEPMILDKLARDLHRQVFNTRGGPRNEDDIRVRAALLLLSFSGHSAQGTAPSPPATIGATAARAPDGG